MSPENTSFNPEQISRPKYEAATDHLIETARKADSKTRDEALRNFLDTVRNDALAGEIRKRNGTGEAYTPDVIAHQLTSLVSEFNDPTIERTQENYQQILTAVPNANGLRASFDRLLTDEQLGQPFFQAIENRYGTNPVEAQETAEKPKTREELRAQMIEETSPEERGILHTYVTEKNAKSAAQRAGDGDGSIYHGQKMGQAERRMSPKAQAWKGRYEWLTGE